MCGQCSFVCPHGVIRPFLLDEIEQRHAPENVKKDLKDSLIKDQNLKYTIGVDFTNCTGCGLCSKICPGKKGVKALTMQPANEVKNYTNIESNKYLFEKVKEHVCMPTTTVKGSQFVKPKFEFSGACAGCGQTPYLKLLTLLFGIEFVTTAMFNITWIIICAIAPAAIKAPSRSDAFVEITKKRQIRIKNKRMINPAPINPNSSQIIEKIISF